MKLDVIVIDFFHWDYQGDWDFDPTYWPDPKAMVKDILNLVRCAWVGSPKYGALVWSGDIDSTFYQMKRQIWNGINMGVAGIPYWISDTGGFYGGNIEDPVFRELLVRWYQWAVFTPVLRMHGDRSPALGGLVSGTDHGGGFNNSGAPNELWSYGEEVYEILRKYLDLRLSLKPYIKGLMKEASETGAPLIRAMFYEFPEDETCWGLEDQYMFGDRYLVAPVTELHATERTLYLPKGEWRHVITGETLAGGGFVTVKAPLDILPVYEKISI